MTFKKIVGWIICLCPLLAHAQQIEPLLEKVNAYSQKHLVEKNHLHLDKISYTTGETIWYKTYTTLGVENLLSNFSRINYVELIDPRGQVVAANKNMMISGLSMGNIVLQDTLMEGNYTLRSYTNWMRNAAPDYFFQQNILISNSRTDKMLTESRLEGEALLLLLKTMEGKALAKTSVHYRWQREGEVLHKGRQSTDEQGQLRLTYKPEYDGAQVFVTFKNDHDVAVEKSMTFHAPSAPNSVQFFPEGGQLLAGQVNNLAIKALRPDGKGIQAELFFITAEQDTANKVQTNSLGMGKVPLFLTSTEAMKVVAVFEDGSKGEFTLPAADTSGYNIQVNNNHPERIYVQVNITEDKLSNEDIYIVAHNVGTVLYVVKQKAVKNNPVFIIPKSALPNGVITLTLINHHHQSVAERAVFAFDATKTLPLTIALDKSAYGPRQKVNTMVDLPRTSADSSMVFLSASVVNLSKINEPLGLAANIWSTLLLSNDIKGFIENPGYYFDGELKAHDLDNLLLTQGWRRLDWTSIDTTSKPTYAVEQSMRIEGYTRKLGRKAAFPQAKVSLISTQNYFDYLDTVSNADGYFVFDNLIYPDSVKFIITAKDDKGKNNIDIIHQQGERVLVGKNRNAAAALNHINTLRKEEMQQGDLYFASLEAQGLMEKSILIESVVVTGRKKNRASENSANLNGSGNADQVISAEELSTCATLEMCLAGRLLGVVFRDGIPYNTRGNVPMQVVLDGMYMEGDQLAMVNVADIQSIEVLRNANYTSIYGSYGGGGLLIISSKTGKDAMANFTPKGIITVQPPGLSLSKTFYKPVYNSAADSPMTQDLRTTIHWEPNLIIDAKGKAAFDFFTSDEKGTYLITLEGINTTGQLLRHTSSFTVQ